MCRITVVQLPKLESLATPFRLDNRQVVRLLFGGLAEWQSTSLLKIGFLNRNTGSIPVSSAIFFKPWKDKPIGGGHSLENCSELMTRVGSTPTLSANIKPRGVVQLVERWSPKPNVVGSSPITPAKLTNSKP